MAALVMVADDRAAATPLQLHLETPQLSGVGVDLGVSASGAAVEPVVGISATRGLAEFVPLSPLVVEELLRTLPSSDSLAVRPSSSLTGPFGPAEVNPEMKNFREIVGEAARSLEAPGLGPGPTSVNRANTPGATRRQPNNTSGVQPTSLKDLVRLLINRPENLSLDVPLVAPSGVTGPSSPQGNSILGLILSIAIDKQMVEALSRVLRPSIDVNGVVALNIFGLREIALLVSPSSNSIRLVDLASKRSVSFRYESPARMAVNQAHRSPGPPGAPQPAIGRENLLPAVIATIRQWIATYVFNGFTLIGLVLSSTFWIIWRLAHRE